MARRIADAIDRELKPKGNAAFQVRDDLELHLLLPPALLAQALVDLLLVHVVALPVVVEEAQ